MSGLNDLSCDEVHVKILDPVIPPFQERRAIRPALETLPQDHAFDSLPAVLFEHFTEPGQVCLDGSLVFDLLCLLFCCYKHII